MKLPNAKDTEKGNTKQHKTKQGRRVPLPILRRGCGLHRGTLFEVSDVHVAVLAVIRRCRIRRCYPYWKAGAAKSLVKGCCGVGYGCCCCTAWHHLLSKALQWPLKVLVSSLGEDESNAVQSCQGSPLFEKMDSPGDYVPMGGAVAAKAISVQPQFVRRRR